MTFPFSLMVARKHVGIILFFKFLTFQQFTNYSPKLVKWKPSFLTSFDITFELYSHLKLVFIHVQSLL